MNKIKIKTGRLMSLQKLLAASLCAFLTATVASGICEHERNRYDGFKKEAEKWGKASILTYGAGSFFSPVGGLAGAGPGAVSWRYDSMAKDALKDYEKCIKRHEDELKQRQMKHAEEVARVREAAKQKQREKLDSLEI